VVLRYAARLNGIDALAVTKLDVLDGIERLHICTGYTIAGRHVTEFPASLPAHVACEPVYVTMPGWSEPTRGAREFDELPVAAQRYLAALEELTGVPVAIVSTGSDREETIIRTGTMAERWLIPATEGAGL